MPQPPGPDGLLPIRIRPPRHRAGARGAGPKAHSFSLKDVIGVAYNCECLLEPVQHTWAEGTCQKLGFSRRRNFGAGTSACRASHSIIST